MSSGGRHFGKEPSPFSELWCSLSSMKLLLLSWGKLETGTHHSQLKTVLVWAIPSTFCACQNGFNSSLHEVLNRGLGCLWGVESCCLQRHWNCVLMQRDNAYHMELYKSSFTIHSEYGCFYPQKYTEEKYSTFLCSPGVWRHKIILYLSCRYSCQFKYKCVALSL